MPHMWRIEPTSEWEKDQKWYAKKRPNELAAVLRNLDRFLGLLNCVPNSKAISAGFLHGEPCGAVAIDQKGGGAHLRETRLYVYADDTKKIVYLITIGDKSSHSQGADIALVKGFVDSLKA